MRKTIITDINHTTHTVGSDTWVSDSVSGDVHTSASAWSTTIRETTSTVHHAIVSAFSHVMGLSGTTIDHVIIVGASSHSAVHSTRRRCTTAKVMLLVLHVATVSTVHGLITTTTSSVAVVVWSLRSIALQGREGVSWFVWIEVDGSIFVEEAS